MVRVLNKKTATAEEISNAIYIGRPGPWGNPFILDVHGTRREVLFMFRLYLDQNPELVERAKKELKGKDLLCFCDPRGCHGHIWREIVNFPDWHEQECFRVSGEMVCPECNLPFWRHYSVAEEAPSLVRACDGRLLKL